MHTRKAPCSAKPFIRLVQSRGRCYFALEILGEVGPCLIDRRKWRHNNYQRTRKDRNGEI